MPRIELECPAWLEAGSRREIVNVKNLSDGGARIQTRAPLVPHEQITLTLDGFRPVSGIVRWVQGTVAGITFAPELPWHELMPWLRRRYRPRVQAPAKAKVTPPVELTTAPPTQERGEIALNLPARVREGSRRWSIEVASVDTRQIRFISYGAVDSGRLFWITLPAWKAGRRAWSRWTATTSPASSRSRCTRPCWNGCSRPGTPERGSVLSVGLGQRLDRLVVAPVAFARAVRIEQGAHESGRADADCGAAHE
jgi:hypothetical protein